MQEAVASPHEYFARTHVSIAARQHFLVARLHGRLVPILNAHGIRWELLQATAQVYVETRHDADQLMSLTEEMALRTLVYECLRHPLTHAIRERLEFGTALIHSQWTPSLVQRLKTCVLALCGHRQLDRPLTIEQSSDLYDEHTLARTNALPPLEWNALKSYLDDHLDLSELHIALVDPDACLDAAQAAAVPSSDPNTDGGAPQRQPDHTVASSAWTWSGFFPDVGGLLRKSQSASRTTTREWHNDAHVNVTSCRESVASGHGADERWGAKDNDGEQRRSTRRRSSIEQAVAGR